MTTDLIWPIKIKFKHNMEKMSGSKWNNLPVGQELLTKKKLLELAQKLLVSSLFAQEIRQKNFWFSDFAVRLTPVL